MVLQAYVALGSATVSDALVAHSARVEWQQLGHNGHCGWLMAMAGVQQAAAG